MDSGNSDGLFRAAIMVSLLSNSYGGSFVMHFAATYARVVFFIELQESGSPYALRNVSGGQPYYDFLVNYTGCAEQADTLACLRQVPADQIQAAVNMTPNSRSYTEHNLAWQPRLDNDLFPQNPQRLVLMGRYAKVMSMPSVVAIRHAIWWVWYGTGTDYLRRLR